MKLRKQVSMFVAMVFVFVSLFSTLGTFASAEEVNVLRGDPSFDSYAVGAGHPSPVFDLIMGDDAQGTAAITDGGANGTPRGFSFESSWQSCMIQAQPSEALKANTNYKFSCYVKGNVYQVLLDIPGDTTDQALTVAMYADPVGGGPKEWTYIEKEFITGSRTLLSGDSQAYRVKIQSGPKAEEGNPPLPAYIDEMVLVEVPPQTPEPTEEPTIAPTVEPGQNLLTFDTGFENGTVGELSSGWTENMTVTDTQAFSGSKSGTLVGNNTFGQIFISDTELKPNTAYQFGAYVKAPGGGCNINPKFSFKEKDAEAATVVEIKRTQAMENWIKLSADFTTPAELVGLDATNNFGIAFWTGSTAYIDDIYLIEVTGEGPDLTGVISNPGFEEDMISVFPNPGWAPFSFSKNPEIEPVIVAAADEEITAYEGDSVLKMAPFNGASIIRQQIKVEKDKKYLATVYVKNVEPYYEDFIRHWCLEGWGKEEQGHDPGHDHQMIPGLISQIGTADENGWIKITNEFIAPEDKVNIVFRYDNFTQEAVDTMYVDALSIEEVLPPTPEPTQEPDTTPSPAPNLLSDDSTFESYDVDGNGAPFINVLNGGVVINEGANETTKSYKMAGGWNTALHQEKVNYVEAGKFYVLGAWVKGTSLPEFCSLTVMDGAANDFVVDLKTEMPTSIEDWTYVSKEFTAPAGAGPNASTLDGFMLLSLQSGSGDFYIDEITVNEIFELSPTPTPEPTVAPTDAPTPTVEPTAEPSEEPTKPNKPKINKVDDNDKVITGKVQKGVKVEIKIKKKTYKATVKGKKFTYKLKKALAAGTKISAFAMNGSVKSSAGKTVVVPHTPKVNKLKAGTKVVKGKATKKAKIFVKVGKKTFKGKANKKGAFSVKVKKLKKNAKVKIRVKAGKKFSAYKTVKVK